MKDGKFYEQALVPEHLTRLSVENLPLDEAFYIFPTQNDDFEDSAPVIFVNADRKLMVSSEYDIDHETNKPGVVIGRVGLMRTVSMTSGTDKITEHIVADLRYVGWHTLVNLTNSSRGLVDQESFMSMMEWIGACIPVDAFIALNEDYDYEAGKKIPKGTYYGPKELHGSLELLEKRGSKLMKKFLSKQAEALGKLPEKPKTEKKIPKLDAAAEVLQRAGLEYLRKQRPTPETTQITESVIAEEKPVNIDMTKKANTSN